MESNVSLQEAVQAHPMYAAIHSEGGYVATPVGWSMFPMLRNRRDTVLLVPAPAELKKGDLPLYMRPNGTLVLHRVRQVCAEGYTMCGDGQTTCEYGVSHAAVLGVAKGFWRDETYIPCTSKRYRIYVKVWCLSLRLRGVFLKFCKKGKTE